MAVARPNLGERSRRRRDGDGRLSFLFLPCARSYSYFVPKCQCAHRCLLIHSVSSATAAPGWLTLHLRQSNIILHLASFSAAHHLNSYHYNQPPNRPHRPLLCICSLPNSPLRPLPPLPPQVSIRYFLTYSPTGSFYQSLSPPCPHFLSAPYFTLSCLRVNRNVRSELTSPISFPVYSHALCF